MNDVNIQTQQEYIVGHTPQRRSRKIKKSTYLFLLVSLLLWGSLIYGAYWSVNYNINENKAYFNSKIQEIKNQNQKDINKLQVKLEQLNTELVNVKNELVIIQEDLALTGETLNGTDQTKQALQQRIDKLNIQLNELQASIQRLEDAASN